MTHNCLNRLNVRPNSRIAQAKPSRQVRRSPGLQWTVPFASGLIILWLACACGHEHREPASDDPPQIIPGTTDSTDTVSTAIDIQFENGAQLSGYEIRPRRLSTGSTLELVFHWSHLPDILPDTLAMFVHLRGDHYLFQADHHLEPDRKSYAQTLTVPDDTPPGLYRIRIGLYDTVTGRRYKASTRLPRRRHAVILPDQLEIRPTP